MKFFVKFSAELIQELELSSILIKISLNILIFRFQILQNGEEIFFELEILLLAVFIFDFDPL